MELVAGYVLALDMTARDFQNEAKAKGHPWAMAKCFDTACPVGEFIPKATLGDPHDVGLVCRVNGQVRQDGNTKDMVRLMQGNNQLGSLSFIKRSLPVNKKRSRTRSLFY